ncbi:MAG: polyhydroxyalkanoate synthesis repressor PhaR [Pseudomonadota bacterium]
MTTRIIKKYPNRRLYDTERSTYITVADVLKLTRQNVEFQVVDANSGEDITRSVLVQVITEREGGSAPIFTTDMLTRFIRVYDDTSQALFGEFLDRNLKMFGEQQKILQDQMGDIVNSPIQIMQNLTERNLTLWKEMQQRFLDLATGAVPGAAGTSPPQKTEPDEKSAPKKKKPVQK